MNTNERHIIKDLHEVLAFVPESITPSDATLLRVATNTVLGAVIKAEEPITNTEKHYEQANDIIEQIQDFVVYRERENWGEYSSFLYGFTQKIIQNTIET